MSAKYIKTLGIVLARTDYGEADRILTFLTPDYGKVKALAKSVRKQKSRLAGGIELFSISQLSFVVGRGELKTLTGSRMVKFYDQIVKDLARTELGYELLRLLDRTTEDAADPGYFILAENALAALNDPKIDITVVKLWVYCRLIRLAGHSPQLRSDSKGHAFESKQKYNFNSDKMAFESFETGSFSTDQIKYLWLNFGSNQPAVIGRIKNSPELAASCLPLAESILQTFARI